MNKLITLLLFVSLKIIYAEDLYKLLGVDKGASVADVKRAFRKKALIYHPDKNKNKIVYMENDPSHQYA